MIFFVYFYGTLNITCTNYGSLYYKIPQFVHVIFNGYIINGLLLKHEQNIAGQICYQHNPHFKLKYLTEWFTYRLLH